MSILYRDLKHLVNTTNKITTNKSFGAIERKLQREYAKQNKDEIKYLKQLIKKVSTDKTVDLSILDNSSELTKQQKLTKLNELLDEKKQFSIPNDFSLMIQDLPKVLQKLTKTKVVRVPTLSTKVKTSPVKTSKMKQEHIREQVVQAKQVLSIEPLDFFTLLPFYTLSPEQTNILEEILDLGDDMMPNKYTVFEHFNNIVEKKHLTGEYFEYNIQQSSTSKKFLELEPSLREVLFDFTKLNKSAIQKARNEMLELNDVLQILYDLKPKNYSNLAPLVIKNIIRIYSNLMKRGNNENIGKYLARSIKVLEHRRKKLQEEIPQLIKDDDKRKFLTKEIATLIVQPIQPIQQEVQDDDLEIGEHYNDRFEDDVEGDLDFDIIDEDDSELLGGEHFLQKS